jgi:hypothetical protein
VKLWIYGQMNGSLLSPCCCRCSSTPNNPRQCLRPTRHQSSPKASCDSLTRAKAMSSTALNTYEKAARNGQPLLSLYR